MVIPQYAPPNAPPVIEFVRVSPDVVPMGASWGGEFVTTTNVASLVVTMPFFSFEVPRLTFGRFAFRTQIFAVPAIYRQTLYGDITAYTANGTSVSVPLRVTFE